MKHKFYLLLVLLISGLFIGCSSDDDGVTPPDYKDGVLVKVMSYNIYSGQKVILEERNGGYCSSD